MFGSWSAMAGVRCFRRCRNSWVLFVGRLYTVRIEAPRTGPKSLYVSPSCACRRNHVKMLKDANTCELLAVDPQRGSQTPWVQLEGSWPGSRPARFPLMEYDSCSTGSLTAPYAPMKVQEDTARHVRTRLERCRRCMDTVGLGPIAPPPPSGCLRRFRWRWSRGTRRHPSYRSERVGSLPRAWR